MNHLNRRELLQSAGFLPAAVQLRGASPQLRGASPPGPGGAPGSAYDWIRRVDPRGGESRPGVSRLRRRSLLK